MISIVSIAPLYGIKRVRDKKGQSKIKIANKNYSNPLVFPLCF